MDTAAGEFTDGLDVAGTNGTFRGLVVGGFDGYGVWVAGSGVKLQGNYIGTDATGTTSNPNARGGVFVNDTPDAVIGGVTPQERNVISGNGGHGIEVPGASDGYLIKGNFIGTAADGVTALGNTGDGVFADSSSNDGVVGGGNVIAFNGGAGIQMESQSYDTGPMTITSNSIHDNGGLGIDLGEDDVTPNHTGDGLPCCPADTDTGPNGLQNFPVISSASVLGSQVTVDYSLTTTPGGTYSVEFFASATRTRLETAREPAISGRPRSRLPRSTPRSPRP